MPVKKDAVHEVWMFILVGFTKLCQKKFSSKNLIAAFDELN